MNAVDKTSSVPNKEGETIILRGPGGIEETVSREELAEEWNLKKMALAFIDAIKPVGDWLKPSKKSDETPN